ncbi:hypothetical protein HYFRA_00003700 [Hymenoscyphus fraxineus]|uniref:Uncharacterized protein n=1 Tax=Hymenoscyphus fraxineus TaxID=746836 RepID=A0A9N9KXR4_9HELO|nr:hypothetical protein HYFRA_00003700 [Hymenoscyphus fraxineus]
MYEMLQNHRILGGSTKYTATAPNNSMTYNFIRKDPFISRNYNHVCNYQDNHSQHSVSNANFRSYLPERSDELKLEDIKTLSKALRIPKLFWTPLADEASSFFGCQESDNSYFRFLVKEKKEQGQRFFDNSDYEIDYAWRKLGVHVAWTPSNTTVLCRGLPSELESSLFDSLENMNQDALSSDPFAFHVILLEGLTAFYDSVLWAWRNEVRDLEQNRPTLPGNPNINFTKTHEIARHAIHSSETLAVAIQTIEVLIEEQHSFTNLNDASRPANHQLNTRRKLRCQLSLMRCLHLRSKALEDRLRNEINLAFNIVAQYNSHVSVSIGDATRADSAVMKSIAFLGLAFLPGSFVCAVFSTSFFNFTPGSDGQSERWTVSKKFWVYWIVAMPVTAATIAFWMFFHKKTTKTSTAIGEKRVH